MTSLILDLYDMYQNKILGFCDYTPSFKKPDNLSFTKTVEIPVMQGLVVQEVFRWLKALTQGEHGRPRKNGSAFPSGRYNAGVSGPKMTKTLRSVTEAK